VVKGDEETRLRGEEEGLIAVRGSRGATAMGGMRGGGRGEGRRTRHGEGKMKVLGIPERGWDWADTNGDGGLAIHPCGAVEAPTVQHAPVFRGADWEVM
jgi:hypothetical protein